MAKKLLIQKRLKCENELLRTCKFAMKCMEIIPAVSEINLPNKENITQSIHHLNQANIIYQNIEQVKQSLQEKEMVQLFIY